jgi:peptidoglycan/LPS O-acetylase OafA/YrhL
VGLPETADQEQLGEAPSPAVAPPPGNPRFALFDSLRAIAVLFVLVFHVTSITGEINRRTIGDLFAILGNEGLILFFMISGFLLYRPYALAHRTGRHAPELARYARRRVLRIVPAYWVALTLLALYPRIDGVFTGQWWRYYLFLPGYSARTVSSGIPTAWSLTVEVSFYIMLPLWAVLIAALARSRASWLRWELGGLVVLAVIGVGVQLAASRLLVSELLATTLLGESVWFALGMAIAVASVAVQQRAQPPRLVSLIAERSGLCWLGALACLIGTAAVLHPGGLFKIIESLHTKQPVARTLGAIVLSAGVGTLLMLPAVFGTTGGGLPRRILGWRPMLGLGLISYGVYLYHLTVAEWIGDPADPAHFSASGLGLVTHVGHLLTLVLLAATFAATVIIATLSYRYVELPFLRLKEPRRTRPTS